MAKKSKTQRAKASAARARKKTEKELQASEIIEQVVVEEQEQSKKKLFSRKKTESATSSVEVKESKKKEIKQEKKPAKKKRFQFLRDVRSELRLVTWPTKKEVLRWSLVVVGALIFFGLFTYVFDILFQSLLTHYSGWGA